jgi:hypothetical protein
MCWPGGESLQDAHFPGLGDENGGRAKKIDLAPIDYYTQVFQSGRVPREVVEIDRIANACIEKIHLTLIDINDGVASYMLAIRRG